jgi:hypothetical protein
MVNVAPAPIVNVPWVTELAVRLPPAAKLVTTAPLKSPTVCVPLSTWNVAVEEVDIAEAAEIWPVEVNSSVPLLCPMNDLIVEEVRRHRM